MLHGMLYFIRNEVRMMCNKNTKTINSKTCFSLLRKLTPSILIIIILFVFFTRLNSFRREHTLTFDETLYPYLAKQLEDGLSAYNVKVPYQNMQEAGQNPQAYLNAPLFKHPPLFPYFIRLSHDIFGFKKESAAFVSIFAGCALVFIAYTIGTMLYNYKIGLLAAFLISIDPVHWICSEKIWMETTLALFFNLGLLLFWVGFKKNSLYFLTSGVAIGMAMLTKYPGALALVIIVIFAAVYKRQLFKKTSFYFLFVITATILLPWIMMNFKLYGIDVFNRILYAHNYQGAYRYLVGLSAVAKVSIVFGAIILVAAAAFYRYFCVYKTRYKTIAMVTLLFVILSFFAYLSFFTSLPRSFINTLNMYYIPTTSWRVGFFANEPWNFYLNRLLELSPFYIFALLSLCLLVTKKEEDGFLILTSIVIISFYMIWGNYQSRYILSAVPALLILSSRFFSICWKKAGHLRNKTMQRILKTILVLAMFYFLFKTILIDTKLALPNTVAYF